MEYRTIKKYVYGDCLGTIYIDLIHEFSGIITDAEMLSDFTEFLWAAFYNDNDSMMIQGELFLCFDEYSFWLSNSGCDPMVNNPKWYRVYYDENYYCDLINPINER